MAVTVDGPSNLNRHLPSGLTRLTYSVTADCLECSSDTDLFEVSSSIRGAGDLGRFLQNTNGECFCPANNPVLRGPTSLEFQESFEEVIIELLVSGVLTAVRGPENVLEVDEETCDKSVNELQSVVFVDFIADTSMVTPDL